MKVAGLPWALLQCPSWARALIVPADMTLLAVLAVVLAVALARERRTAE